MTERLKASDYQEALGVDYTSWVKVELPNDLARNQILRRLGEHVRKKENPLAPAIGAILGVGDHSKRAGVMFGLHPSELYGTPSAEDNEGFARHIAKTEGWRETPEDLSGLRVPLGRRRGYDSRNGEIRTLDVRSAFRQRGREALKFTAADLFSIRFMPEEADGLRVYHEPGVLLDISQTDVDDGVINDIKEVAASMSQDMFVVSLAGIRTQVYRQPRKT